MSMSRDDERAFEAIVASIDYPMFIVTTAAGGRCGGCLVGFATQTSINPAEFMVGLSRHNHTYRVAREAAALLVHCPSEDQVALAELFGGHTADEVDKFARCGWSEGPEGLPLLDDCPNWFAGRIIKRMDVGDHGGFLLQVCAAAHGREARPLRFQQVRHIEPGHPP